ncbi:MAG: hypothetical protein R3310_03320 [Candidatus Competibacteraceae bacterium]|nr:hypothetical protein [Candidatus Competibacteraceae bacterium]
MNAFIRFVFLFVCIFFVNDVLAGPVLIKDTKKGEGGAEAFGIDFYFAVHGVLQTQFYLDEETNILKFNVPYQENSDTCPFSLFEQLSFFAEFDQIANYRIYFGVIGEAPNRRIVLQWDVEDEWQEGERKYSHHLILYETSQEILVVLMDYRYAIKLEPDGNCYQGEWKFNHGYERIDISDTPSPPKDEGEYTNKFGS